MKILQLDLIAFGPFSNITLDFPSGQFGLHLVYGPNEAGKSSMLRSLRQVLYGIDRQTADDFRVSYKNLKLGATLQNHQGQVLAFTRLKRDKNSLRTAEDGVLNDDCLDPFLGHVDETAFQRQFGLNWDELVKGGQEMLRSEGEMARILFAAGSGLSAMSAVYEAMEQEMRDLFLLTGSKPVVNALLQQLKTAEDSLRQSRLSSDEWQHHAEAVKQARQRQQELIRHKKSLERERHRLGRIQNAKTPIKKYQETLHELEKLKHVVILPAGFADRRLKVRDAFREALQSQAGIQNNLNRLAEQIQEIQFDQTLLDQATEIEWLNQEIGAYKKSLRDFPKINSLREAAENEAKRLLKDLRPSASWEDVDDLHLAQADREAIRELGQDQKVLSERAESARRKLRETRQQLEDLEERFQGESDVPDVSPLKSAIKRATSRGPLEEERAEKRRALEWADQQSLEDCRRLPFWSGTLEELEKIRVPLRETVNQFQIRFDEAARTLDDLQKQHGREQAALQDIAEAFEMLELDGKIPTEQDLIAARQRRGEGWRLILRQWREGEDCPAELKSFVDQMDAADLPAAFQDAVEKADEISDQLRQQAKRVNEKLRLLAECKKVESRLPALERQIAEAKDQLDSIEQEWRGLWQPLGIKAASPAEMREWLQSHMTLMTAVKRLAPDRQHIQLLDDLIQEHRERLLACLEQIHPAEEVSPDSSLRALVELSQTVLDEVSERQSARNRLQEDIAKARQSLARLEQEADEAQSKLCAWQSQWADLMRKLGLSPEATPTQANAILDTLDRLFERVREEEQMAIRVRDMGEFNAVFEERVQAVINALGWEADDLSPTQWVAKLYEALSQNREAANQLAKLRKNRGQQQQWLEDTAWKIKQHQAELLEMCQTAGCDDPEELVQAERNSDRREQLEQDLRDARAQILEFAGDAGFEAFLQEAQTEDADALNGQLSEWDRQIEEVDERLTEQMRRTANEQSLLETKSGGSQAALAAEAKQAILAELNTHLERYVQLRLSLEVLRDGAERYRKKHEGPVLKRASALFSQLTGGSFARLQIDGDDQGKPRLVGVRQHAGALESVEIKGMSDGTADQLYLALRIASLEDWLDHHPPMPFIVDDILINFDDDRAIAALKVLAELSRRTQVIFSTHHLHLVELAEAHLSAHDFHLHELGPAKRRRKKRSQAASTQEAATLF